MSSSAKDRPDPTFRDLFEAVAYVELLAANPAAAALYAQELGGIPRLWGLRAPGADTIRVRCIDLFRSPVLDRQTLLALVAWLQDRLDRGERAVWSMPLADVAAILEAAQGTFGTCGQAGRRGYPIEALEMARALAADNPSLTAKQLRRACLRRFDRDQLPPNARAFRAWLRRPRKK